MKLAQVITLTNDPSVVASIYTSGISLIWRDPSFS